MRRNGHKFNAVRTEVDGIKFSSKAEAKRYGELKLLEKAGRISHIVLQPKYPLYTQKPTDTGWQSSVVGHYVADFAYLNANGEQVIEDVKGMKTALYRWKKKHFEMQQGQMITEITR